MTPPQQEYPNKVVPRALFFQVVGALSGLDGKIVFNANGMHWAGKLLSESYDDTQSRPSPAPKEPQPCEIEGDPCLCLDGTPCQCMKQHDAAIVAATRMEVLDEITKKLNEWRMPFQKYPASIGKNEMRELIESLRSTPSAPEQEERR